MYIIPDCKSSNNEYIKYILYEIKEELNFFYLKIRKEICGIYMDMDNSIVDTSFIVYDYFVTMEGF